MSKYSAGVLTALPLAGAEWEAMQIAAGAALGQAWQAGPWTALPHQEPPPGAWDTWLLMGGRGSGKTAAAAHYTNEHVSGPACLPGLPGGHRVAIIAPTFGDALEACVNGPSGLRAHNPSIRSVQTAGGTFVRWPSGAEAKLFGASTPEDVERLRAGGNRCLAGDTLVRTPSGRRPIRDIVAGDDVLTRNGARRVLRAGMTQAQARLWHLETDRGDLFATADHEVLTARGWLPVRLLAPHDTLASWSFLEPFTSSSMTASAGIRCETDTTRRAVAACCIGTSGRANADRSLTAGTSTIGSMATRRRPIPLASSASRRSNINTSTRVPMSGTERAAWQPGTCVRRLLPSASSAARTTSIVLDGRHGSARPAVERGITESLAPAAHTRDGCARCAALSSEPSRQDPPGHAHVAVRACSPTDRVEPVYDLLVEHDHEFFAGDLVVSNCLAYAEELAAWRFLDQCWDHLQFGLRLGPHPRIVAATTPKPKRLIKAMLADPSVAVTRATTHDNPHLVESVRARLQARYGGTRLGRQEIMAELLDDNPGALWTWAMLEDRRAAPSDLVRVVVAVDPSGGADPENDEQGIIVAGTGPDARGYVLADRTCRLSPDGWGRRAVQAYVDFKADAIVGEANFGGDMVEAVIRTAARAMGVTGVSYKAVHASRGKAVRAQPVAALYEQGRVSHCDVFAELEEELTSWTTESGQSPNRLDGLVWAISDLMVKDQREVYVY